MKKLLGVLVVIAVLVWIVDQSGFGYWKSEPPDTTWTSRVMGQKPVALYIKIGGKEYLFTDHSVNSLIQQLGNHETRYRVSILGRRLPDTDKKPNAIYVEYEGHQAFTKLFEFGDPQDTFGEKVGDYLDNLGQLNAPPPPPGWKLNTE